MTDSELQRYTDGIIPPETRDPLEMIDKLINQQRVNLEFARQASASQQQQAEDTAETKRHIVTPFKRFKLHGARMYAEAAVRALRRTKDEKNPLFLAIENIFPERFGGHPQELKFVIDESRKWFVDLLTEKQIKHGNPTRDTPLEDTRGVSENPWYMGKMDKKQAEELAKKHIRATIDTGHMNLWRKYWQPKQGQNIEQSEKEFKQWYLKEFKSLVKGGYVGNIHLTDNYGFQDDHIAPGQGNAPIREVMRILKENGYDEAITTEPGADASTDLSDFHGLMKTWRYLGNTVYGTGLGGGGGGGGAPQNWGTLQYSYFGQNKPPYFVFGSYAPSNDWTLWSQVPME